MVGISKPMDRRMDKQWDKYQFSPCLLTRIRSVSLFRHTIRRLHECCEFNIVKLVSVSYWPLWENNLIWTCGTSLKLHLIFSQDTSVAQQGTLRCAVVKALYEEYRSGFQCLVCHDSVDRNLHEQDIIPVGCISPAWKSDVLQFQLPHQTSLLGSRSINEQVWTGLQWSPPDVTWEGRSLGLMWGGHPTMWPITWCIWCYLPPLPVTRDIKY